MNPLELPNLAAWYDLALPASTTSNDIRIDGSNRVSLIADKSGNSATNCLCCNTSSGTIPATSPDSAAVSITGSIEMLMRVRFSDYTPASNIPLIYKYGAAGQRSWAWLFRTNGAMEFVASYDGTATVSSTGSVIAYTDLTAYWLRVTFNPSTGALAFFYASDTGSTSTIPSSWTTAGSATLSTGTIFDSTAQIAIGGDGISCFVGSIYRAQIYNGIGGTLAFDANFATASKLATSFTESSSNAATVTINSSGDLGARISGERDLVQLTASKQPIYLPWSGTNYGFTNTVVGNFFSTPDSAALDLTGSFDVDACVAASDWTPAATQWFMGKDVATKRTFAFGLTSAGRLYVEAYDSAGTGRTFTSSVSPTVSDGDTLWVRARVTWALAGNIAVDFFTSTDGSTWSALGTQQTGAATGNALGNFDNALYVGARQFVGFEQPLNGRIFRARIYSGDRSSGGTLVADFNPSLYTSGTTFPASTGETWTLNGGATIVNRTSVYFDGSDDYMKAAAFSLSQPETVYFTGQQVSWTVNRTLFDGGVNLSGASIQSGTTPSLAAYSDPGTIATNANLPVSTNGVLTQIVGTGSVSLRVNRGTTASANGTTAAANGFTLASRGAGASQVANIRANEVCIYAAAHDTSVQDRVIQYAGRKWGISGV